ncbi:MAG: tetratricopeptide repeat protein [Hymenobacteraceae bacterium]|nr:tetratricopeptide repeat protein [Hymenobacteraceae bacterium]
MLGRPSAHAQASERPTLVPPDAPREARKRAREAEKAAKLEQKRREKEAKQVEDTHGGPGGKLLSPQEREATEALFIDGVKFLEIDEPNRAFEKLVKAWQIDPTNAAVNYKLAETSAKLNQMLEAVAYGKAAVRLEPKNRFYYLLLAQLYTGRQQYEDAAEVYAGLLREIPESEKYLFPLADLYILTSRYDQALEALGRAEKKFGVVEETALKKQQIYLKRHDLPKAVAEGEALIAANPLEVRYVLSLAALLTTSDEPVKAQEQVARALRLAPDHPQALLLRADLRRTTGDADGAEEDVRRAFRSPDLDIDARVRILVEYIKRLPAAETTPKLTTIQARTRQTALDLAALTIQTNPREAKAYAVAGDLQTLAGLKAEARASYLSAVRFDNSKYKIWQQIVLLDADLDQTDSLLRHSDRALALFPNQPVLYFYNGAALLLKKEYAKAARSLEYGRKLVPDEPELRRQFDMQLGDAYEELKQYGKSMAAYDNVLATDPDNATVLNNYAYFLSVRGQQLEKARTMSERLVKLHPNNGTYLDTHAWVLYKLGQYDSAREYLERALKNTPDPDVLEHYGDVLWHLGRTDDALRLWQRARQLQREPSDTLERKIQDKNLYE